MNAYTADADLLTWRDDGPRPLSEVHALVIHTDESDTTADGTGTAWTADRLAEYNREAPEDKNRGSYHLGIDRAGRVVRQNDDEFATWSVGNVGNRRCLHVCLTGTARTPREVWLSRYPDQLDQLAEVLANYCRALTIPARRLAPHELAAGARGIAGHWDCTHAWSGGRGHWDPGGYSNTAGGFPWDYVIDTTARILTPPAPPAPTPDLEDTDMGLTPRQAHQLDDVTAQLTGSPDPGTFPGWPQLGDLTPVDYLAQLGERLGDALARVAELERKATP